MADPPEESRAPDFPEADSEQRLIERARAGQPVGSRATLHAVRVVAPAVGRGRLPVWARDGLDTSDLVQDALHETLSRITTFRSAHAAALRGYLRRTVENQISDHRRRALFRLNHGGAPSEPVRLSDEAAPQLRELMGKQNWARYLEGLKQMTPRHRRLIVGRVELGYSYRQLALIDGSTPDAARMALGRALARLSVVMPDA